MTAHMDPLTTAFYHMKFKMDFMEKGEDEFQDFFSSIMEARYPGDFIRVRPWGKAGDQKNDGYLKSQRTLFQAYAPSSHVEAKTIAKIDTDFNEALPHWEEHFDTWVFVHNSRDGLSPNVLKKLLELDKHPSITVKALGFSELRDEVFALEEVKIAQILGSVPSQRDFIQLELEAVTPLLDQIARLPPPPEPDLRPPPADKIQRNMLSDFVGTLLKAGMARVDLVRKYFSFKPASKDAVAETLTQRYRELKAGELAPDDIFLGLQKFVGGSEVQSPQRSCAVLAVLAYFFEACDIFEGEPSTGAES